MEEVWKDIPGYEGWYEVSNLGNVRSLKRRATKRNGEKTIYVRTKNLSPARCGKGGDYLFVRLCSDNIRKRFQVHRLVALAFIPNPNNYEQVDHINRKKNDNRVENLRWVTQSENQYNTDRNRLISYKGQTKPMGKWAEQFGLRYHVLSARLRYGWSIERALETPLDIEKSLKRRKVGNK